MENQPVGKIIEVDGNHLTAALYDNATGISGNIGQVDTYLTVHQGDSRILVTIHRSWLKQENGREISMINCMPLGEISSTDRFSAGLSNYPMTGAEVYTTTSEELKKIFLQNAEFDFSLGHLRKHKDIPIYLNPSLLFGRHLAILGQSGSGKSWTVTSLIQNTLKSMPNAHIILLDLHGEYCWKDQNGKLKAAFDSKQMRYVDVRSLEIPYWLLTYSELIDLLIDRNDPGAPTQIAYLREVLKILRQDANKHLKIDRLSVDSPVYFSLKDMLLHFKKANEAQSDFGKTKGPLYGQFDEFLVKLQSKLNDARYDFLFRPKRRRSSESLEDLLRDFSGLTDPKRQITVIDLSPIPSDIHPIVASQLARLAFEFNYWNPKRSRFPIQLICEEAHAYIPRSNDPRFRGTRQAIERIAKEGRKYGVGLTVVTQRPHELSETVLSQCSSYICMRLTNPDDQLYVRRLVPEGNEKLTDTLSALSRGEALILGEAIPLSSRLQINLPDPPPNSNDADYFNNWKHDVEDIDVAEIVDHWRNQQR